MSITEIAVGANGACIWSTVRSQESRLSFAMKHPASTMVFAILIYMLYGCVGVDQDNTLQILYQSIHVPCWAYTSVSLVLSYLGV